MSELRGREIDLGVVSIEVVLKAIGAYQLTQGGGVD